METNYAYITPLEGELYKDYIQRILDSRPNEKIDNVYMERHHILPKSKGGTWEKTNIVYLYPQEHYYAHMLLAQENPQDYQLVWGWVRTSYVNGIFISADESARLKILKSQVHVSEETRQRQSEKMKGRYIGLNSEVAKPIYCEETGYINYTAREAEEVYNISYKIISSVLKGVKQKTAKGLHFRYATSEEISFEKNRRMYEGDFPLQLSEEMKEQIQNYKYVRPKPSQETRKKFAEAARKRHLEHPEILGDKRGIKNPRAHSVINIDTQEIFLTIQEACDKYNLKSSNISKVCLGKRNICGNYHWRYVTESEIQEEKERRSNNGETTEKNMLS